MNSQMDAKKRVLVTGATGFIGQHVVAALEKCKQYDICRLVRSAAAANQITDLHTMSKDMSPTTDWSEILVNVEVIIHTAARVHIMKEKARDSLHAFRMMNVEATLNLARQAASAGVKRFIFLSSVKVNGEETSLNQPYVADDHPMPEDAYAISKHEAEKGLLSLAKQTGLEVVIIRPPLVYGPGVKGNLPQLIAGIEKRIPLPFKMIKNKRSFVSIDNLVSLLLHCISHSQATNQIFLVSDGEDLSTPELISTIATILKKPARLFALPRWSLIGVAALLGKRAVVQRLCGSLQVDIAKTQTVLNWKPHLNVEAGLQRLLSKCSKPGISQPIDPL